jgi:uncharacterized protein
MPLRCLDTEECMDYTENQYLVKKLGLDSFLITTEHGEWIVLDKKGYDLLRLNRLHRSQEIFNKLEDKGIIITEGNINSIVETYKKRKWYMFTGPSLHIVSMTSRCNHRCIYCYVSASPENSKGSDMDEDTAKTVVDFIFQSPSKWVTIEISGGEPLLNFPVVESIIDYSNEVNKRFKRDLMHTIVTNLSVIDEDIIKFFIENRVGISTSLDGPKELHDKNRRYVGGSSYEKTTYWIEVLKKQYKYPSLGALPVVTKYSFDYGKEIVDEYVKYDLESLRFKYASPVGYARLWDKIGYSPKEYVELWKNVLDYILHLNREGTDFREGMTALLMKKIINPVDPNFVDLSMPCGAVFGQTVYDDKGDVYTCDEGRAFDIFNLGNVKECTYEDIARSMTAGYMQDLSSGYSFLCDNCVWKPYCGICVVCAYSTQGNMVSKLPLDFRCQAHKGMLDHLFRKLVFSEDRGLLTKWADADRF